MPFKWSRKHRRDGDGSVIPWCCWVCSLSYCACACLKKVLNIFYPGLVIWPVMKCFAKRSILYTWITTIVSNTISILTLSLWLIASKFDCFSNILFQSLHVMVLHLAEHVPQPPNVPHVRRQWASRWTAQPVRHVCVSTCHHNIIKLCLFLRNCLGGGHRARLLNRSMPVIQPKPGSSKPPFSWAWRSFYSMLSHRVWFLCRWTTTL